MLSVAFPVATTHPDSFREVTSNGLVQCVKPDCCSGEGEHLKMVVAGLSVWAGCESSGLPRAGRVQGSCQAFLGLRPRTQRPPVYGNTGGGYGLRGSLAEAILVRNRF